MSELAIQSGFRNRLRYVAPAVLFVAIPNAAKRTQWAARQAKAEGLAAGFPDAQCIWPGGGICFIEFKAAKGRLSDNQAEWIERLLERGHKAAVVRSVEEALDFLRACGAPVLNSKTNGTDCAATQPAPSPAKRSWRDE